MSKELKQVKANQAVEIKRLCAKLIEERRVHAAAVETCYESAERQRKDDINRVKGAEVHLSRSQRPGLAAHTQALHSSLAEDPPPNAHHPPPTAHHPLPTTHYPPPMTHHPPPVTLHPWLPQAGLEAYRLREASARAQASAASEVRAIK